MKNTCFRLIVTAIILVGSYPVFALPSFRGDWESGLVTGSGNTNWAGLQAVAPDRFNLVNDGVRPGTYARVEVRNGDNPLACCNDTDRAEVSGMQDASSKAIVENLSSGTQRYTFSVKFDKDWQTIAGDGAFGSFLQLHGPGDNSPAMAFSATDQIRLNMLVGDITKPIAFGLGPTLGSLNLGQWTDFSLTVRFASDNTGFVNILRRDEGDAFFQEVLSIQDTPTLQFSPDVDGGAVGGHYWKHGLYRNRQDFTSVLYLDGFTREAVMAVPEPNTYAMMLAGLAFIGFAVRRRRE